MEIKIKCFVCGELRKRYKETEYCERCYEPAAKAEREAKIQEEGMKGRDF